jgi:hypothetical protein
MTPHLGLGQLEDQPAAADVGALQTERVTQKRAQRLRRGS